jgi:hypothetical protein
VHVTPERADHAKIWEAEVVSRGAVEVSALQGGIFEEDMEVREAVVSIG